MNEFKLFLETTKEVGYINSFFHSIAFVTGLPGLELDEMIITESGKKGIVHGLKRGVAEVLMVETEKLRIGERVTRTNKKFEISIGEELLGRIVDPILRPLDANGPILGQKEKRPVKKEAPEILSREKIKTPLETGVMLVDLLVPIGYGQRELIIGDAKTGKTTFLLQTIVSQARKGLISVYVGIAKKDTAIKFVEEYLRKQRVLNKTIIVHTTPDDSPTLIYLAPYAGMTIAEYFKEKTGNVLIILDDLTTHAKIFREISLLMRKNPGRDCFPGDIFYLHSQLLERAGNFKNGTSITALPVGETLENDLAGYIQTNLMAMTDGHIFFDATEFKKGKRPAINTFLSVTRVGNQTKTKIEKDLANFLRKKMVDYQRISEFIKFGAELSLESQKILEFGKRIEILFNQPADVIIDRKTQIILAGLLISGFWDEKSEEKMKEELEKLISASQKKLLPDLGERIDKIKEIEHLKFLIKNILEKIEKILKL